MIQQMRVTHFYFSCQSEIYVSGFLLTTQLEIFSFRSETKKFKNLTKFQAFYFFEVNIFNLFFFQLGKFFPFFLSTIFNLLALLTSTRNKRRRRQQDEDATFFQLFMCYKCDFYRENFSFEKPSNCR